MTGGEATYIWQRAEWPAFRWDDGIVLPHLADARFRQGRLLGRMEALGFDLGRRAELLVRTDDALQTAAIEGEALARPEVRSSVARRLDVTIDDALVADRAVDGLVELLFDATTRNDEPLTPERLFSWHRMLLDHRSGVIVGRWRDDARGPMQVVSGPMGRETVHFEAPPADRVHGEMARFCDWVNAPSAEDSLVRAAIAHLWCVTIHPFEDGNGRIARAVAELMLARSDGTPRRFYSMSDEIHRARTDYYRVLEWTQKGDLDITNWLTWFFETLRSAFDRSEKKLAGIEQRDSFWRAVATESLNERQTRVLQRMLEDDFEGFMTSSKWARMTATSQDTAGRDIRDLVERGILVQNPAGGRSTSYRLAA